MKKIGIALMVIAILFTAVVPMNGAFAVTINPSDYANAFTKSIQFYDANRCGSGVATGNIFSWRTACHTTDGSDVGKDLTGGYHDAGDHVKFGQPQAFSAAVLGTALYEFKSTFDAQGNTSKMLSTLKYFTDYFLKCHTDANTFYYQIGDGNADHGYWGPPELQSGSRLTLYVANPATPASDVCGTTAGALALMYLNYKSTDATYAAKCLTAAKELYTLGKTYKGLGSGQTFYVSNGYWDDLAFAATWLYVAENNSAYLTEIDSYLSYNTKWGNSPFQDQWTFCWDSVYDLVFCKMAELTGQQKYKDAMTFNFNFWKSGITTTPGGLKYLPSDGWGSLKYAAAESMLALLYYKQTSDPWLTSFAKSQLDYILGANPMNKSYLVGFGSSYPTHPHHRAANPTMGTATYTLTGALIGGPNNQDQFIDDVNQYMYTEVALDYNAGFVGALAGAVKYLGGGTATPTPSGATATPTPTPSAATTTPTSTPSTATATPTPTPSTATATPTPTPSTSTPTPTPMATAGGIKVMMYNGTTASTVQSLNPHFKLVNTGTSAINLADVKIRYYFTEDGTQALVFACDWASAGNANITNSFATVAKTNADHYCEIGFTSGAGTLAAGAYTEIHIQIHKSDWSNMTQTNDYSFNASATNYVDWPSATGYIAGALKWGTEP